MPYLNQGKYRAKKILKEKGKGAGTRLIVPLYELLKKPQGRKVIFHHLLSFYLRTRKFPDRTPLLSSLISTMIINASTPLNWGGNRLTLVTW